MIEFTTGLHAHIYAFESWVSAQFDDIEAPDVGKIWKEVAILRVEVLFFNDSLILVIPSVIPYFAYLMSLCGPRYFYLFTEDNSIPGIGNKGAMMEDL